jgi:hypothetical protein
MNRSATQPGYVLILTLLILVMAGVLLASTARSSLEHAAQARASTLELQRRWGMISIRQALLPHVGTFISVDYDRRKQTWDLQRRRQASPGRVVPPAPQFSPTLQLPITLGSIQFTAILRDESARLNVNLAHDQLENNERLNRVITQLTGSTQRRIGLRLAPVAGRAVRRFDEDDRRAFNHFSQVFEDPTPVRLLGPSHDDDGLIQHLTCWGTGKLNVQRCSPATLAALLSTTLPPDAVRAILELRKQNPEYTLGELLSRSQVPQTHYGWAYESLADQSDCYSVWIVASSGRRTWHQWIVREPAPDGEQTLEFAW